MTCPACSASEGVGEGVPVLCDQHRAERAAIIAERLDRLAATWPPRREIPPERHRR